MRQLVKLARQQVCTNQNVTVSFHKINCQPPLNQPPTMSNQLPMKSTVHLILADQCLHVHVATLSLVLTIQVLSNTYYALCEVKSLLRREKVHSMNACRDQSDRQVGQYTGW